MKRLTRDELAERLDPLPPSDAFWRRAIETGRASIGVGPEAVAGEGERPTAEPAATGPLATGDIVDVGDRAFVVVGVEETRSGGRRYRIELVDEPA
ncbi:hypothetical protein GJ633_08760 [Halorubrum sp. CBA1125]|uniref:hypothetical protein n=1 Tax=Halorubrum sp. CBA1125 TaxID=2668072 RepID=UPI0012E7CC6F|nr:hypothetical protein [Halorubrum sp. CBA1125]MUW14749.1 hypothetical protein [Halorubrum sp. CBA1125]